MIIDQFPPSVIKIKILCNWTSSALLHNSYKRLCKTQDGRWNNIKLTDIDETPDYYVIINFPNGQTYNPEKTILITMEPKLYRDSYFPSGWKEPKKNKNVAHYFEKHNGIEWYLNKSYTHLSNESIFKSKIMSSVTSGKMETEGHRKRLLFLKYLDEGKEGINFDLYGVSNPLNNSKYIGSLPSMEKEGGLFPYKYSIACENSLADGYFTEKIVDCVLSECLCFYWGCPNLEEFINKESYIRIDLDDFEKSKKIIKQSIENNEWEKRIDLIRIEKTKILNELQLLPTIEKLIITDKTFSK